MAPYCKGPLPTRVKHAPSPTLLSLPGRDGGGGDNATGVEVAVALAVAAAAAAALAVSATAEGNGGDEDDDNACSQQGTQEEVEEEEVVSTYSLVAVSNHFGGTGGGHYTAHVRSEGDGKWYECDDGSVTCVSPPATNPCSAVTLDCASAYVLFYLRDDMTPETWGGPRPLRSSAASAAGLTSLSGGDTDDDGGDVDGGGGGDTRMVTAAGEENKGGGDSDVTDKGDADGRANSPRADEEGRVGCNGSIQQQLEFGID